MKVLYYIQHKFVKVSKGETSLSVSHIMLQRECDINSKQLFIQFHPSGERHCRSGEFLWDWFWKLWKTRGSTTLDNNHPFSRPLLHQWNRLRSVWKTNWLGWCLGGSNLSKFLPNTTKAKYKPCSPFKSVFSSGLESAEWLVERKLPSWVEISQHHFDGGKRSHSRRPQSNVNSETKCEHSNI